MRTRKTKLERDKIEAPASSDLENLGMNLRKFRVLHGLTQSQLAEAVNLNIRTLQRIEAGQTNILVTTVIRLMNALECTPNDLLQPHTVSDLPH